MRRGPPRTPAPEEWTRWIRRPRWPPACIVSFFVHFIVMLLLGLSGTIERGGTPWVAGGQVSVALVSSASDAQLYDDEPGESAGAPPGPVVELAEGGGNGDGPQSSEGAAGGPFDDEPPVDPSGALPSQQIARGGGGPEGLAAASARDLLEGGGGARGSGGSALSTLPKGGRARTSVFGVQGEGYKFVYVFDHSASMGGSGYSPLSAAKAELKGSLENIAETHQFQIIFYNDHTTVFPLAGQRGRLVFGNEANKDRAKGFIDGITATGGTHHEEAILEALKYGADVIFFLTDADQPELTAAQLERISSRNGGRASINTIQFGLGPQIETENFLARLARQNGGQYVYYDIARLGVKEQ